MEGSRDGCKGTIGISKYRYRSSSVIESVKLVFKGTVILVEVVLVKTICCKDKVIFFWWEYDCDYRTVEIVIAQIEGD